MFKTLEELIAVIRQRKESSIKESYTNKLLNNKKLSVEKVKEEIAELIDAIEKRYKQSSRSSRCFISFNGAFRSKWY